MAKARDGAEEKVEVKVEAKAELKNLRSRPPLEP